MTDLRQAAQAVIDRWDSPLWKNGSTADAIADLRTALEQKPHAWAVEGSSIILRGEYAELDAKSEAWRIGGTCVAYPLYT